jgi:O-antigen ligase
MFPLFLIFIALSYAALFQILGNARAFIPSALLVVCSYLAANQSKHFRLIACSKPLSLLFLYLLIRIPFSAVPYKALFFTADFGVFIAAYFSCASIRSKGIQNTLISLLLILGGWLALYAIGLHLAGLSCVLWKDRLPRIGIRSVGTHANPNHFAHFLNILAPFYVSEFLSNSKSLWRKFLILFLLSSMGTAVYLSGSIMGSVCFVLAVFLTSGCILFKRNRRVGLIALFSTPCIATLAIATLYYFSAPFQSRLLYYIQAVRDPSAFSLRIPVWQDTAQMISTRPLFGVGLGCFSPTYPLFQAHFRWVNTTVHYAHNELVHCLTETGIVGTILFLSAFMWIITRTVRQWIGSEQGQSTLAAALLGAFSATTVQSMVDFPLRIFPNALLLSILTGTVLSREAPPLLSKTRRISKKKGFFIGLASVALILPISLSRWFCDAGNRFVKKGKLFTAERYYERSLDAIPFNAEALLGLGKVYDHYRRLAETQSDATLFSGIEMDFLQKALRANPYEHDAMTIFSSALLSDGKQEAALYILCKRMHLRKFYPSYYTHYASIAYANGLYFHGIYALSALPSLNPPLKDRIRYRSYYHQMLELHRIAVLIHQGTLLPVELLSYGNLYATSYFWRTADVKGFEVNPDMAYFYTVQAKVEEPRDH